MPLIVWKAEYSVENRDLDAQHQKLMDLINELHEGMLQGKGALVLQPVLDRLISYTKNHFKAEEQYMQAAGFPHSLAHKQQHEKLTQEVAQFITDVRSGKLTLSLQISQFLKQWLDRHILGSDQQYVRHCRATKSLGAQALAR